MRSLVRVLVVVVLVLAALTAAGLVYVRSTGLSARATPGRIEAFIASRARAWAVPAEYRDRANPLPRTREHVRAGLEHFADHCASCHGNDGSGSTSLGRSFFPPAPDMRSDAAQRLTDGELLYVIEHGIRFTGMPAWGDGSEEGERLGWQLVQFIRHLPRLTAEELAEMEALNPRPPAEIRQQIEEERFLSGQ